MKFHDNLKIAPGEYLYAIGREAKIKYEPDVSPSLPYATARVEGVGGMTYGPRFATVQAAGDFLASKGYRFSPVYLQRKV